MPKTKKTVPAKKQKLTPEQRSQIAKDRWAKRRVNATEKTDEVIEVTWQDITQQEMPIEEAKERFGRDPNGVPPVVGLGDGTITSDGTFVPDPTPPVEAPAPQLVPVAPKKQKRYTGPKEFSVALKAAQNRLAKAMVERAETAARLAFLQAEIPNLVDIIRALGGSVAPMPPMPFDSTTLQAPIPQYNIPSALQALQAAQVAPPVSRAQGGAVQFGPEVVGALEGPEDDDPDRFISGPNAGGGWIGG